MKWRERRRKERENMGTQRLENFSIIDIEVPGHKRDPESFGLHSLPPKTPWYDMVGFLKITPHSYIESTVHPCESVLNVHLYLSVSAGDPKRIREVMSEFG
ncbi:hypothetical protein RB195_016574 [Necator americanus]|uniref:Uncharacterized protein n=1 Tax=Necator americanus TaxID=51031 RepID=A0ABR1C165_NECAM